jgi:hypothetical protein
MRPFTNHLKVESALIQSGLELLSAYRCDLEEGKSISIAELRMAIFGIHKIFEMSHILKEESILYPALVKSVEWKNISDLDRSEIHAVFDTIGFVHRGLLALRLTVDEWEHDPRKRNNVQWMLGDFLDQSRNYFKNETQRLFVVAEGILTPADQKNLYVLSQNFEQDQGNDASGQARAIFNQLREARGMKAA